MDTKTNPYSESPKLLHKTHLLAPSPSPASLPYPRTMNFEDDHDDDGPIFLHRNRFDVNSKIMLVAIVSLSVVVVLVVLLHIYARCVLRRQARRRSIIQNLSLSAAAASAHAVPGQLPKTGLEASVIASLPTFVFRKEEEPIECAVCLSMLEDQEMAMVLPNCNHTFHAECVDKWLTSHSTCPICRTEAEPRASPEETNEALAAGSGPTAPPLERGNSMCVEGPSDGGAQCSAKVNGSSSRLSSFRKMISREKSSRRLTLHEQEDDTDRDLERQ